MTNHRKTDAIKCVLKGILENCRASVFFNFTTTPFADLIVVFALLKRVVDRNLSPLKIFSRNAFEFATSIFSTGLVCLSILISIKIRTGI